MDDQDFRCELAAVVNRHGKDREANTPDFILADIMAVALERYIRGVSATAKWRGDEQSAACRCDEGDSSSPHETVCTACKG